MPKYHVLVTNSKAIARLTRFRFRFRVRVNGIRSHDAHAMAPYSFVFGYLDGQRGGGSLFFLYLGQIDDNLLIECGLPVGQHDEAV